MGIWKRLAESGKTTGIREIGERLGNNDGHRIKKWDFTNRQERKFGRGFYAAINRMPESDYKQMILRLVKRKLASRGRGQGLTEKQWKYLGVLMSKADPACVQNPRVKSMETATRRQNSKAGEYVGIRKARG